MSIIFYRRSYIRPRLFYTDNKRSKCNYIKIARRISFEMVSGVIISILFYSISIILIFSYCCNWMRIKHRITWLDFNWYHWIIDYNPTIVVICDPMMLGLEIGKVYQWIFSNIIFTLHFMYNIYLLKELWVILW